MANAHASSSRRPIANGRTNGAIARPSQDDQVQANGAPVPDGEDGSEHEDGSEEEEEGWTIDTFKSRPLEKSNAAMLEIRTLEDNFKEVIKKLDEGLERAKEAAVQIEEADPDNEMIDEIEKTVFRTLEQRQTMQFKVDILEEVLMRLRQNDPVTDAVRSFEQRCAELEEAYVAKTARAKFKDVEIYDDFRKAIWDVHHMNEPMPPLTSFIPREEDDASDDDDFEMGGTTQNYRCPITLQPFVNPVTSTLCHHSFSRDAIFDLLDKAKRPRGHIECPQSGCNAHLTKTVLREDKMLQKRTDTYYNRLRQQMEEGDQSMVDISQ